MATTDSRKPAPIVLENVDLGGGVRVTLGVDAVGISGPGPTSSNYLAYTPRTRQEANRMSIALKKACRRLQAIGSNLPEEAR